MKAAILTTGTYITCDQCVREGQERIRAELRRELGNKGYKQYAAYADKEQEVA